ncbi:hypothetical protein OSSY52_08720 [Tepiditoga spiralis]|uniref:ABC transmembrane type-1 domain-containing protein n=1 Tax=Tepiditoga spiralis TaxID=2108365 RepID=A0A7G1G314_9BACT|nr:ABC transporter permease subunit [Tepiditoga spiralis]BBE30731.1 hypothetical protein OSSY52_08720 [Tepiditoga spiralis]
MKMGMKTKRNIEKTFLYILVFIMIIFYIFPFVWSILSSITSNKYLFRENLGITFESGAVVNSVHGNTIANKANFKMKDIIKEVNGIKIKNSSQLINVLNKIDKNNPVEFKVKRKIRVIVVNGIEINYITNLKDVLNDYKETKEIEYMKMGNSLYINGARFEYSEKLINIVKTIQETKNANYQVKELNKIIPIKADLSSVKELKDKTNIIGLDIDDKRFTFSNYILVFSERPFLRYIWNSIIVAGTTTILSLIFGAFAGYSVARLKIPGKIAIMSLILAVSMFPQISILGGLFKILRNLNLINHYWGLIIPYIAINLPLTTWILQNFFRDLPASIEESAYIDGCSKFMTLWRIVIPLSIPAFVTTGLLTFIAAWNEFLFAFTFITETNMYTVPVAIAMFSGKSQYEVPWGQLMAASVIITVPLVIMVLVFQKKIVAGLTSGAVKG